MSLLAELTAEEIEFARKIEQKVKAMAFLLGVPLFWFWLSWSSLLNHS